MKSKRPLHRLARDERFSLDRRGVPVISLGKQRTVEPQFRLLFGIVHDLKAHAPGNSTGEALDVIVQTRRPCRIRDDEFIGLAEEDGGVPARSRNDWKAVTVPFSQA